MEVVNGAADAGEDRGAPPPPSPLTGCYLLIVIGEPHSKEHKDIVMQRVAKGLLSWDVNDCLVDLGKELAIITEQALEGEEARYGERLIQFASENLVTEILIHPVVSTLSQCVRNLLSSFTRHRHIIHAGYTFTNNGSWILQDGTFSLADFSEALQEPEVLRVIRAYDNNISIDLHCAPEGDWTRLPKEPFTKNCRFRINPTDVLDTDLPFITHFINYLEPFLIPARIESVLESSDVVGNIRFSRPTLYVFPGGQGDAALFGINGFNMLLDGGFSRKACFWDFVRHLDRLDAVLLTRINNSNIGGISAVLNRKRQNATYPQIGHFFCNLQERKSVLSPDGDKDVDPLLVNLMDQGQEIVSNLKHLSLTPQVCYRDSEPINLYHKVGHGTLDMYVLSPVKESKEVREFLQRWNQHDQKLFTQNITCGKDLFPLQNIVSICVLLVWQPANPEDTITRILFPGSSPKGKMFEGLDRIKNLEFIKHPTCTEKGLTSNNNKSKIDRILEKKVDNKIGDTEPKKAVKKSDSTESEDKSTTAKPKKATENNNQRPKPRLEVARTKRSDSQQRKVTLAKKTSPTTPKKSIVEPAKPKPKSPSSTPAKSTKEANNRKVVVESKVKAVPKKEPPPKKTERKPISRRPRDISKPPQSPKKVSDVQKPVKRGKFDKEGTTDSSTLSTPSADQETILKTKLTCEEIQQELKDEQEAIKEIEEVFRKGETTVSDKGENFRQIEDVSVDDKLESEEYLIIEKTEIVTDVKEEAEKPQEGVKEQSVTSPEDKVSTGDKNIDKESQEKGSANIESGATTTAPTLPEDERMPLVEIKETASDHDEEKHVKEDAKEKSDAPPPLAPRVENITKLPQVVGLRLDKQTHIRDIVKTPDEVADLPVHEEVDYQDYRDPKDEVTKAAKDTQPDLNKKELSKSPDEEKDTDDVEAGKFHVINKDFEKAEFNETGFAYVSQDVTMGDDMEADKKKHEEQIEVVKQDIRNIQDIDDKLQKMKDDVERRKSMNEIAIGHTIEERQHAESVILPADSNPESPVIELARDEIVEGTPKTAEPVETEAREASAEKINAHVDVVAKELPAPEELLDSDLEVKESEPKKIESKDEEDLPIEEETEIKESPTGKKGESPVIEVSIPEVKDLDFKDEKDQEKPSAEDIKAPDVAEKELPTKKELTDIAPEVKQLPSDDIESKDEVAVEEVVSKELKEDIVNIQSEIASKEEVAHQDLVPESSAEDIKKAIPTTKDIPAPKEDASEIRKDQHPVSTNDVATKDVPAKKEVPEEEKTKTDDKPSKDKTPVEEVVSNDPKEETIDIASAEEVAKEPVAHQKVIDHGPESSAEDKKHEIPTKDIPAPKDDVSEIKEDQHAVSTKDVATKDISAKKEVSDVVPEVKKSPIDNVKSKDEIPAEAVLSKDPKEETVNIASTEEVAKEPVVHQEIVDHVQESSAEDTNEISTTKDIPAPRDDVPEVKPVPTTTNEISTTKDIPAPRDDVPEVKTVPTTDLPVQKEPPTVEEIPEKDEATKDPSPQKDIVDKVPDAKETIAKKEEVSAQKPVLDTEVPEQTITKDDSVAIEDTMELGRKSPKEREEDVAKIVASVAVVLKSDAPLEEFEGKIPFEVPYTTELRETHITTMDSPEEPSKVGKLMRESKELMEATSKLITDIREPGHSPKDEDDQITVHRMLVTASSEDGGEEIEICPPGTITFSRSSESSGRSSPEPKVSQRSSIGDTTTSDPTVKDAAQEVEPADEGLTSHEPVRKKSVSETFGSKLDKVPENIEPLVGEVDCKFNLQEGLEAVEKMVVDVLTADRADSPEKSESEDMIHKIEHKVEQMIEKGVEEVKEIARRLSLSEDKVHKEMEEKEEVLAKSAEDLEDNYEKLTEITSSVVFDKCDKDPKSHILQDLGGFVEHTKDTISSFLRRDSSAHETPSGKSSPASLKQDSGRSSPGVIAEESLKQSESGISSPGLVKEATSSGKSTPPLEDVIDKDSEKGERFLESTGKDIEDNFKKLSDMSESVVFEKCDDHKDDPEKVLERAGDDISKNYEEMSELTKSVVFEKCDSVEEPKEDEVEEVKKRPEDKVAEVAEARKDSLTLELAKEVAEARKDSITLDSSKEVKEARKDSITLDSSKEVQEARKDSITLDLSKVPEARKDSITLDSSKEVQEARKDSITLELSKELPEARKDSITLDLSKEVPEARKDSITLDLSKEVPEARKDSITLDSSKEVQEARKDSITLDLSKEVPEARKDSITLALSKEVPEARKDSITLDLSKEVPKARKDSITLDSSKEVQEARKDSTTLDLSKEVPEARKDSITLDLSKSVTAEKDKKLEDPTKESTEKAESSKVVLPSQTDAQEVSHINGEQEIEISKEKTSPDIDDKEKCAILKETTSINLNGTAEQSSPQDFPPEKVDMTKSVILSDFESKKDEHIIQDQDKTADLSAKITLDTSVEDTKSVLNGGTHIPKDVEPVDMTESIISIQGDSKLETISKDHVQVAEAQVTKTISEVEPKAVIDGKEKEKVQISPDEKDEDTSAVLSSEKEKTKAIESEEKSPVEAIEAVKGSDADKEHPSESQAKLGEEKQDKEKIHISPNEKDEDTSTVSSEKENIKEMGSEIQSQEKKKGTIDMTQSVVCSDADKERKEICSIPSESHGKIGQAIVEEKQSAEDAKSSTKVSDLQADDMTKSIIISDVIEDKGETDKKNGHHDGKVAEINLSKESDMSKSIITAEAVTALVLDEKSQIADTKSVTPEGKDHALLKDEQRDVEKVEVQKEVTEKFDMTKSMIDSEPVSVTKDEKSEITVLVKDSNSVEPVLKDVAAHETDQVSQVIKSVDEEPKKDTKQVNKSETTVLNGEMTSSILFDSKVEEPRTHLLVQDNGQAKKLSISDVQISLDEVATTADFLQKEKISSAEPSQAKHIPIESDYSDDDDDAPGSPTSMTSQIAHSTSYELDEDKKRDPMSTSFYGSLPEPDKDSGSEKPASPSHLCELTRAQREALKDPLKDWGKPLGLPSPAPLNGDTNKGTPKKERRLPASVSAKNKLNDDIRRSESPSKCDRKSKIVPVYVDLAYVPHHGNANYVYVDFFRRVRARYYVFSGIEPSREAYGALLEAKQTWEDKDLEVTIIPTYDTDILGYWVAENEELLTKYKIDLSPSASRCTINLQDHETSCSAYRLEF